jgi:hypothetical protein
VDGNTFLAHFIPLLCCLSVTVVMLESDDGGVMVEVLMCENMRGRHKVARSSHLTSRV